jgi:hypothetical protein
MIVFCYSMKAAFGVSASFDPLCDNFDSLCDNIVRHVQHVRCRQELFNRKLEHVGREIGVDALGAMTLRQIHDYKPKF